MNIGIDARPLSYTLTGIGIYLRHLLEELQKIDEVNHYFLISNGPIQLNLQNPNWSKIQGRIKKRLLSTLWMQSQTPFIACRNDLDVFWSPRHHLPLLLSSRIKTVLTIHDITYRLFPETMAVPNLLVEKLLMRHSLKRADCVIAMSQSTRKGLVKYFFINPDKITIVYPGTPSLPKSSFYHNKPPMNLPDRYFLFVGALDPRKNLTSALKAFELIGPENHDVFLVVVGNGGSKYKKLMQYISSHKNRDRIIFTGYVLRSKLKYIYEKSIGLLFPSLYEGFGFPILEAMSCGTPVITSEVSSLPEVAGDAAVLVNPNNVSAIASAMLEILTNFEKRHVMIAKGYQRADDFSWEKCAADTLNLLSMAQKA